MNLGANVIGKAADKLGTLVLGKSTKFHSTRVVEALLKENRRGGASSDFVDDFDYLYIDPRVKGGGSSTSQPQASQVIFFAIGGGSYLEYCNLKTVVEEVDGGTNVIYGSTDMKTGTQFLNEVVTNAL